ncbi:FecR family protein [Maribacter cobaltidurans]|uniref:FecR family protein n=1 Tax=Maribacter cobaltidurans TaxID=1178778 RepID=UPI001315A9EC|nr:FecR domain-containing protein [Maribacter cobaltidurans]
MIADIIIRKIKGHLNQEEEILFENWLSEKDENLLTFKRLQKLHELKVPIPDIEELDAQKAWQLLLDAQRKQRKGVVRFSSRTLLRYAAIFVGIFGCFLAYRSFKSEATVIEPIDPNSITLDLGNGNTQVLTREGTLQIVNSEGEVLGKKVDGLVDYSQSKSDDVDDSAPEYNTLRIPNGKTFKVVLSDGTLVHLNAGSSLKYPVQFQKDKNREVVLIGEGFFEVTKNESSPFIVTSGGVDVRVLGTKFNVTSYPEDKRQNTVLVEGSVRIYETGSTYDVENSTLLSPGYKAEWNPEEKNMQLEKVPTELYTGWINGKLMMKEMVFSNIVKRLQRHYNVNITSEYQELNSRVFTATFEKESIREVLETFKLETPFDYEIEGNHILIKRQPKTDKPMGKV